MSNRRRTTVDHRGLARSADDLSAVLADAVDELQEATRRESVLQEGAEENRDELAATYPGLKGKR